MHSHWTVNKTHSGRNLSSACVLDSKAKAQDSQQTRSSHLQWLSSYRDQEEKTENKTLNRHSSLGRGTEKEFHNPKSIFRILIGVSSLSGGRIGLGAGAMQQGNPSVLAVWLSQFWLCACSWCLFCKSPLLCCLREQPSFPVVTASAWGWAPQRIICCKTLLVLEVGVTAGLGQWLTPRTWYDLTGRCLNYSHLCTILHQGSWDRLGGTGFTQTGVINMSMWRVRQDSGLKVQDKANNVRCTQRCQPSRLLIANWWVQVRL